MFKVAGRVKYATTELSFEIFDIAVKIVFLGKAIYLESNQEGKEEFVKKQS